MKNSARADGVVVSADGRGLVSQAGTVSLWETMRVTGLARGSRKARPEQPTGRDELPGITNGSVSASASCGCTCVIQEP
ncbi:MAG: hypothetical protein JO139_13095 [Alphaproteobacteria bacterium]|nr:hypothetical protein [Alphaproteobacteria bacterium]